MLYLLSNRIVYSIGYIGIGVPFYSYRIMLESKHIEGCMLGGRSLIGALFFFGRPGKRGVFFRLSEYRTGEEFYGDQTMQVYGRFYLS